jgi:transposase
MKRLAYSSDTTDAEWTIIAEYIPAPLPNGRPPKWERREIVDAILYVLKTGCPWNMVPHDFPPYSTVFWYFRQWRKDGTWEKLNTALREQSRQNQGREAQPSAAIIDSQSVKTTEKGGSGVMMRGRK